MLLIEQALDADDRAALCAELDLAVWKPGKRTARGAARRVKANEQASGVDGAAGFVRAALERHALVQSYARPARFGPVLFARYGVGMSYGDHIDEPLMGQGEGRIRTDLSFTLFLAEPESYQGGELMIELSGGVQAVKLQAGDAVLYPSGAIHRVAPVTAGERRVAVGWIQSLIPDAAARETLFDLARARAAPDAAGLLLAKVEADLMRRWARP